MMRTKVERSTNRVGSRKPQRQRAVSMIAGAPDQAQSQGCWIDLYDAPVFGGKLRRIVGPTTFNPSDHRGMKAGSLVVGPEAVVLLGRKPNHKQLRPGTVLPDLKKLRGPLKLTLFQIRRSQQSQSAR